MFLNRGRVLLRNLNFNRIVFNSRGEIKLFSSKASHGHENGHSEVSHEHSHEGHDDHGHHEITGEVDLNKVNVPLNANLSRFISLTGAPLSDRTVNHLIEGQLKAKGEITPISIPLITRNRVYFNDLANVRYEDNPYFHPEPYGYLVSDDPWDPNPQTWQPFMVIVFGFFGLLIFTRIFRLYNIRDKNVLSEEIYHAHYTANLIEDEIRRIRREDYPYRKKYEQLKNGATA